MNMKYILATLIVVGLCSYRATSQVVVSVVAKPQGSNEFISNVPSFGFSEPFKLVVDVSGVPNLSGIEPLYLWSFLGAINAPANGDFCNSNEASIMTKEGANLWSINIPSIKSYMAVGYKQAKDIAVSQGRPADQTRFGFLIKRDDGCSGGQSNDITIPFTGPVYIKEEFEFFPLNSSAKDVVTLIYNQELEDNTSMKAQSEVYLYAIANLAGGGILEPVAPSEVGNTASLKLTKSGTQHTISIIPNDFFEVPADKQISSINVLLRSKTDAEVNFGSTKQVRIVTIK
jgi:hypothetical protein